MTHEASLTRLSGTPRTAKASPVLISVADVMLGTAAARSAPIRRVNVLQRLRTGWLARRDRPVHRADYLERAAMTREMYRL